MHIHEGAWVMDRVQALGDWSPEGQKRSTSSSLRFQLIWWLSAWGGWNSAKQLKKMPWTNLCHSNRIFTTDALSLLLLLLLPNSHLFGDSLKIVITETCSRASIMARCTSLNGLGLRCLLLCQKALSSPFPLGPPTQTAYKIMFFLTVQFSMWHKMCLLTEQNSLVPL